MNPKDSIILTPAGQGARLHAFGETVTILVGSEQSGNVSCQWLEEVPPEGGPPPHLHENEDEWFYVLEGTVSFFDGRDGRWTEGAPGWSAFMPRGVVHTFKNTGDTTARLLVTTTPGGFDTFFGRCAEVFAQPGPPDMGRIMAIAGEHGIRFVQP
jgi:quercetin dioxygenase-like cupin family protein